MATVSTHNSIIALSTPLLRPFDLLMLFICSPWLCLKEPLTWINWDTVIADNVLMRIEPGTWKFLPTLLNKWTWTEAAIFVKEIHVNQIWLMTSTRISLERRKGIGRYKCVRIFANTSYRCLFFTGYLNKGIFVCRFVKRGVRGTRGWVTEEEFPVNVVFQYVSGWTSFIWIALTRSCVPTADYSFKLN